MNNVIIGTAGHIDHGKTSLIRKLTGKDTDRLKEEKERGITIDLGFTFFDLPSGRRAGIIDVPGHEKFIKNMLAGVSGVDFTILVISAEEGIMPQTEEHLNILSLLNVKKGLIALTKSDLVDDEWLDYIKEEVGSHVKGTFLENAPIVPVSSVTGLGMDQLTKLLDTMTMEGEDRDTSSIFRVPIDRVFSVQGFGTVVTGTLISGSIREGDKAMLFPSGTETRVRNIQVHDVSVKQAFSGQRVALNLAAVKKSEIKRGDVLSCIDAMEPTMILDVKLNLLSNALREIKDRDRLRLYHGTSEILCRIRFFDREKLEPGEDCYCQLRLEEQIVARRGDNYVVRFYSPMITVGGGTIVDPAPPKRKKAKDDVIQQLILKEKGESKEVVENIISSNKEQYLTLADLIRLTGTGADTLKLLIENLKDEEQIHILNTGEEEYIIHKEQIDNLRNNITNTLVNFYKKHPLRQGLSKEEIKSKLLQKIKPKLADKIIELVTDHSDIKLVNNYIVSPSFKPNIDPKTKETIEFIRRKYEDYGYSPQKLSELIKEVNQREDILKEIINYLMEKQELVKIEEDIYISSTALDKAKSLIIDYIKTNGNLTVAQFRDITNISRKQSLQILEYFDNIKTTKRVEDKRILY